MPAVGVALVAGRLAHPDDDLDARSAGSDLGVGNLIPQGQDPLEMRELLGRADPPGDEPCVNGGCQGARQVVRSGPVESQAAQDRQSWLGIRVDTCLQDGGEIRVQSGSLVGEQVVVHGLTQQAVPERQRVARAPQEVRVE